MKPALLVLPVYLCVASVSLSAQDRARGKDITPPEVQQKFYKWGDTEREDKSFAARMASASQQWMNRYTNPIDGFVVLPTGERLVGKLTLHNRLTAQALKGGATDPNADVIQHVIISHDGRTDSLALSGVAAFGARFTPSDWAPKKNSKDPADRFNAGFVQLDNDVRLEGVVALTSSQVDAPLLRTFDRVYFALNFESPVEIYLTSRSAKPGVPNVLEAGQKGGTDAAYHLLSGGLVDQNAWIAQLEKDPKKLQTEPLIPAEVVFNNGAVLKGRLGMSRDKIKTSAFLIDEDGDLLRISSSASIKVINANANGVAQQIVVLSGEFVNNQEAIAKFEKNESIHPGKIMLATGVELVGRVSLKRDFNMVKSYRIPRGAYFQPKGDQALLSYYTPDQMEYVEEEADGATTRYAPLENSLVEQDKFLAGLEAMKSGTKTRNLQPGYVMMLDGTKQSGRLAQQGGGVVLVDASNRFKKYRPTDKGVSYFVQTIDGVERRFIPLQGGEHAFSAAAMEFVEIIGADKAYSWYRNPNPTHIRKFVTGLVKGAVNTATDVGRVQLANAAAKQEVRASLEKSPGDVGSAVVAGAQAQQGVLENTKDVVVVSDEGGLYYKEWVVVNNATKEKVVVYSGNDKQELTRLLGQCPKYAGLESRAARRLTDVGNLEEAVNFLNGCR